jgi:hypothetical protein
MSHKEVNLEQPQGTEKTPIDVITENHEGDDVALAALVGSISDLDIDGPEAKEVLRKIDLNLLPMLCITYMIQVRYIPEPYATWISIRLLI